MLLLVAPVWVVIIAAVAAVGFFVVGLSLTLIFKGHHIESEISTNPNMQRLGIKCAVQESREDGGQVACSDDAPTVGCGGNCAACDIEHKN